MAPCFVLFVAFLGLFLCLVFGFLVVYSLYTPWGPLFGFNTIAYLSKKKKKNIYSVNHMGTINSFVLSNPHSYSAFV